MLGDQDEAARREPALFDVGPIEETREDGSYADRSASVEHKTSYQWQHSLSEIVNALAGNGLRVEFLHEFPFCMFQWLPSMVKDEDGWWRVPGHDKCPSLLPQGVEVVGFSASPVLPVELYRPVSNQATDPTVEIPARFRGTSSP